MKQALTLIFWCTLCVSMSAQEWVTLSNSAVTARHHPVTFTLDNTAYLVSGTTLQSNPEGTTDFFKYDADNDDWIQLDDFPGPSRSYAYAETYDGKAYFGLGSNDFDSFHSDLWKYNPQTEEWTELASCPCGGRAHPAFVQHNGKIFMGLGQNPFDRNDWWEYDIDSDTWTERPSLPGPPRHHPFHFQAGDYVYAGFGHSGTNYYDDWYRYDPVNHQWEEMNPHPAGPRVAGQEFSYEGYGFVISGDGSNHLNLADGEFWKYDHHEDDWIRLPDHPGNPGDGRVGRWAPGVFVLDHHAYFFGGVNRSGGFLYGDLHKFDLREVVSATEESITSGAPVNIYPNPAKDVIHLDESLFENGSVEIHITDISGKTIFSGPLSQASMSVSNWSTGLYYLRARDHEGNKYTGSFVVGK